MSLTQKGNTLNTLHNVIEKLKAFFAKYRIVITTTVVTALALDIITGLIFGFGGAALFALV